MLVDLDMSRSNNVTPINLIEGSNTASQFEALESFHDHNNKKKSLRCLMLNS